jgi:DNA-binding protein HU-beta
MVGRAIRKIRRFIFYSSWGRLMAKEVFNEIEIQAPAECVLRVLGDFPAITSGILSSAEYAALAIAETTKRRVFVLPGIGRSLLVKRKARKGRNLATGESIQIPAKTAVKIKPAKAFKEAIVL